MRNMHTWYRGPAAAQTPGPRPPSKPEPGWRSPAGPPPPAGAAPPPQCPGPAGWPAGPRYTAWSQGPGAPCPQTVSEGPGQWEFAQPHGKTGPDGVSGSRALHPQSCRNSRRLCRCAYVMFWGQNQGSSITSASGLFAAVKAKGKKNPEAIAPGKGAFRCSADGAPGR